MLKNWSKLYDVATLLLDTTNMSTLEEKYPSWHAYQRRENHAHNDVPVPLRPTTLEKRHIQVLLEDLLEKFLADKRKRGSGILTFKKGVGRSIFFFKLEVSESQK